VELEVFITLLLSKKVGLDKGEASSFFVQMTVVTGPPVDTQLKV